MYVYYHLRVIRWSNLHWCGWGLLRECLQLGIVDLGLQTGRKMKRGERGGREREREKGGGGGMKNTSIVLRQRSIRNLQC